MILIRQSSKIDYHCHHVRGDTRDYFPSRLILFFSLQVDGALQLFLGTKIRVQVCVQLSCKGQGIILIRTSNALAI